MDCPKCGTELKPLALKSAGNSTRVMRLQCECPCGIWTGHISQTIRTPRPPKEDLSHLSLMDRMKIRVEERLVEKANEQAVRRGAIK